MRKVKSVLSCLFPQVARNFGRRSLIIFALKPEHPRWFAAWGVLWVFPLAFSAGIVLAQEPPDLVTDRPDQGESPVTVPRGSFQIETGWLFTRDETAGQDSIAQQFPGTLLRVGISASVELRLTVDGWQSLDVGGSSSSGFGDASVGTKVHLWSEEGRRPETAFSASISIPVGQEGFSTEGFDPSFRAAFSNTLSDRLSIAYNAGFSWFTEEPTPGVKNTSVFADYTATIAAGLTPETGAFLELFGALALDEDEESTLLFDGGVTYLISQNAQVDIAVGVGLSDAAEDLFVGVGVSWRLPE